MPPASTLAKPLLSMTPHESKMTAVKVNNHSKMQTTIFLRTSEAFLWDVPTYPVPEGHNANPLLISCSAQGNRQMGQRVKVTQHFFCNDQNGTEISIYTYPVRCKVP